MEEPNKNIQQIDEANIEPIEGNAPTNVNKQKYSTIQEYLDKLLSASYEVGENAK